MQPVDYTTLIGSCCELRSNWLPARLEQVYQRDRFTISLALRTLKGRGWLDISWHPQAARICISTPPPRVADTFTFSDQLRHQLSGLALVDIAEVAPWERVLDLQFAKRPGEAALWHLYVEIMTKYSNVILTGKDNLIVTAAHQVSSQQSSVRPIQTGDRYELPPGLTDPIPKLEEPLEKWQERVSLIPDLLKRQLMKSYRGLSSTLAVGLMAAANLESDRTTDSLSNEEWEKLFQQWRQWLTALETGKFEPVWTATGYSVMGWGKIGESPANVQELLNEYYTQELNGQEFRQLQHQISQKLQTLLKKLGVKLAEFNQRLQQSEKADLYRSQADLLMASLHEWQPGMKSITLADFETSAPVKIPLEPEKNAVQNAQSLYKRHQKMKRARMAIAPLIEAVREEINYLEQVEAALYQVANYRKPGDLQTLTEIRGELIEEGYLTIPDYRPQNLGTETEFYRYVTPGGFELLVGRNNQQNDRLTFRVATDYDLWFHTQEIPGSHALLRLPAGQVPDDNDLQFTANITAYYSRARQSEQVPVIYTQPKYVYKPKGAKPGMVIYKNEQVLWGVPQQAIALLGLDG
ncbi:MAG: NFACT RNA binding domain-containing protein [Limnospira sp. PMC 1291.21]|uniref:Rqc2 homolog RqcH n=2 Tax=Limnospira TaxID=2596745 RepID=A0A9P1KI67_9CYAN|nr:MULTISPECIES: NFACT RNA binding domain-containing protein [Limnospira]EKD09276.1 fibronectin-binding A-like protein [Arthrospira platensis C1]MDC0839844.1 NFACT RNA binding domain-containing protein [Limnoraphis robusta]MDY7051333.1 NFACT RNA binding domain-containing protein [Limnospira fusiformis LS22]QJB24673.1 fibronectin/fibrinogen-binding protein [Limnospira fusiformis SAG 85.79]MDT9179637.1 NFACT RNA binding domain-containing protein [Limnospira sp. PMC 1238.20]